MAVFYERLKEIRHVKQISVAVLAEHLGLSPDHVLDYENGTAEPTIDVLIRLSKLFGVSVDYLVGLSNSTKPVFEISSEEKHIITSYREMKPGDKKVFSDILFNLFKK